MSKVKTITATATEQAVTFDATYQFVWFRSLGDGDVLVSDHSGIIEGADDVALVKAGGSTRITVPYNKTVYVKAVSDSVDMEIHAQNFSDVPFKSRAKGGGQSITVEPLTVTKNDVYTAPTGKAYSPVTVDVQEEPWQPLQDGCSNFWFELTDDTLSPWLNFTAKNDNAVIDWGDGSGEQALTTLTPTHTYSKAGKYVVKCKGVTGIDRIFARPYDVAYNQTLKYIELNDEVTALNTYAFQFCLGLKKCSAEALSSIGTHSFANCVNAVSINLPSTITQIPNQVFANCYSFKSIDLPNAITSIGISSFNGCIGLETITIPATVSSIGNTAFSSNYSLYEIHCQATTPPTLGNNSFENMPSNYMIYVPVGTAETYKAASGWSTYADHILEEGQQPNRAMLAKFNSAKTEEVKDDELYKDENR